MHAAATQGKNDPPHGTVIGIALPKWCDASFQLSVRKRMCVHFMQIRESTDSSRKHVHAPHSVEMPVPAFDRPLPASLRPAVSTIPVSACLPAYLPAQCFASVAATCGVHYPCERLPACLPGCTIMCQLAAPLLFARLYMPTHQPRSHLPGVPPAPACGWACVHACVCTLHGECSLHACALQAFYHPSWDSSTIKLPYSTIFYLYAFFSCPHCRNNPYQATRSLARCRARSPSGGGRALSALRGAQRRTPCAAAWPRSMWWLTRSCS